MHIIANRPQFGKDFEATREDYLKANASSLVGLKWFKYIFRRVWLEIKAWRHAHKLTKTDSSRDLYRL